MAQTVKNPPVDYRTPGFSPWVEKIPWRREQLPTPVVLPGEFHGHRSLVGYRPWVCRELHTTELHSFTDNWSWLMAKYKDPDLK